MADLKERQGIMFGFGGRDKDDSGNGEEARGYGSRGGVKVRMGSAKDPEFRLLWDDRADYDPEEGRERWIVGEGSSKTIDLEGVTSVDMALISGRIDVIGHDGPDARLEISNVRQDEVRVGLVNGRLIVAHPQGDGRTHNLSVNSAFDVFRRKGLTGGPSADVSLMVPREVALRIECVNGDILVSGMTAGADLDSVNGSVLANGMSGTVKLDTVNGKIEARNHHGKVKANSVNGDVIVSGVCEKITMDSVNGHLYADLFGRPSSIRVDGVNAVADLRLDHDIHAKYKAEGMHAKIIIDGVTHKAKFGDDIKHEEGPLEAPVTKIHADGVNARIKVTHRAPEDGEASNDWQAAFGSQPNPTEGNEG